MIEMAELLDDVMDQAELWFTPPVRSSGFEEPLVCHGCGQIKPDVDVWAEHSGTGEQVLLCQACGEA